MIKLFILLLFLYCMFSISVDLYMDYIFENKRFSISRSLLKSKYEAQEIINEKIGREVQLLNKQLKVIYWVIVVPMGGISFGVLRRNINIFFLTLENRKLQREISINKGKIKVKEIIEEDIERRKNLGLL